MDYIFDEFPIKIVHAVIDINTIYFYLILFLSSTQKFYNVPPHSD
jgi:hypothetical protein